MLEIRFIVRAFVIPNVAVHESNVPEPKPLLVVPIHPLKNGGSHEVEVKGEIVHEDSARGVAHLANLFVHQPQLVVIIIGAAIIEIAAAEGVKYSGLAVVG